MASSPARRPRPRTAARFAFTVIAALLLVTLVVLVPMVGFAILSPFSGVPVPGACAGGSELPNARHASVPGHGEGTVIAADGPTTVVVVAGPDGRTAGGSVHVIAGGQAVFSLPVVSRAVAAGVGEGRAYVFDDKIGYVLGAASGLPEPRMLTVDNYRGLYMADGVEHVQTSLEIVIVGAPGQPFVVQGLPFGAVVDGCLVAAAVDG
ncbi:MAG TPA: hypothetical protein VFQ75_02770 [Candidatus Limnocylindrales bacterium]|nr:hypothetical protein [Candidatus Limnocylindrales bacterium]